MNKRRLNMLKKDLQLVIKRDKKLKEKNLTFDMKWWAEEQECGTVCCAAGLHCLLHPEADLTLIDGDVIKEKKELTLKSDPLAYCDLALEAYFDISDTAVKRLFFPSYYREYEPSKPIPPERVIQRIDELLETGEITE